MMHARAVALIASLNLRPHPEGGYYGEVYRSSSLVMPGDTRAERSALTTIYFLLPAGDVSRWHLVASDEAWHFYEGAPLELLTADRHFTRIERTMVGPVADASQPVHVVPANIWQAARSTGAYTLVGCTVGPGFDFADFQLLRTAPAEADSARARHPGIAEFI
jgi:uncharacterized protein